MSALKVPRLYFTSTDAPAPDEIVVGTRWFNPVTGVMSTWTGTYWAEEPLTRTKTVTIVNPIAPLAVTVWHATTKCQLTSIEAEFQGGTGATVNARKNGVDLHLVSDLAAGADSFAAGEPILHADYVDGDVSEILITGLTGAVTQVTVQLGFQTAKSS